MLARLLQTLISTLGDVLPLIAVLVVFQVFVLRRPILDLRRTVIGIVYVLVGLTFFLQGLEQALFPIGRLMADQLTAPAFLYGAAAPPAIPRWHDYLWVYAFAAATGFSTAIAEPALLAVSMKAAEISGGTITASRLRVAVAVGVAIGITLGTLRIVTGAPLHWFIIAGHVVVVIQTAFAPKLIVPLAYDSGVVATSTVTVPLVTALGLGLANNVPGRSPLLDGFGLIAFACLFPIMTVMGYAQLGAFLTARAKRRRERDREE